jgi:hypothetical protein
MRPRIFLNYAREDRDKVGKLHEALIVAGYDAWMDVESMSGGEKWRNAIEGQIAQSDFFVACLTHQSVSKRGVVREEIDIALAVSEARSREDIFIIPVRLEVCALPQQLCRASTASICSMSRPYRDCWPQFTKDYAGEVLRYCVLNRTNISWMTMHLHYADLWSMRFVGEGDISSPSMKA